MNKIQRSEWGARPPKFIPAGISTESGTDHWEGTTLGVFDHESCPTKVQVIQDFHMDARGWSDIAYNFLVCPHGFVFVGRDHGIRSAANGDNYGNNTSEAACYIGGPGDIFTDAGRSALHELNQEIGGITYPHQHWFNTQCPGSDIIDWLNNGQPVTGIPDQPPPAIPDSNIDLSPWPDFPLPAGHWYGKPSKDSRNHSGYYNSSERPAISLIQQTLRDCASQNLGIDGYYYTATEQAVLNFQEFFGIGVDGKTGPETWGTLGFARAHFYGKI